MHAWILNTPQTTIYIVIELLNNFIQIFVFFNDIAFVNKTESDFSFTLYNAICDQCNKNAILFIVRSIKNREEKVMIR